MNGPRVEYSAHSVKRTSEQIGDLTEINLHNHSWLYATFMLNLNVTGINKINLKDKKKKRIIAVILLVVVHLAVWVIRGQTYKRGMENRLVLFWWLQMWVKSNSFVF